jgi:hypothetical protein
MMEEGTEWEKIIQSELPAYDYTGAHVWLHTPKYWSNWTTRVTGYGQGYLEIENIAPYKGSTSYHVAKKGAEFFVFNCLDALDANNEWYYEPSEQALYIYHPDGVLPSEPIYVKRRMNAFDLQGKSHVQIKNLQIKAATVAMDEKTSHVVMDGLKILYPYHSYQANRYFGTQGDTGVRMYGKHCIIQNSEIGYSSGCGIALMGEYNQVLNCYIHDTDYVGAFLGGVQLRGKGNVISHCTLTRAGRTVIDYGNMYKSLIQYCDMSQSGLLTSDLGLTYGNTIEGGNSEVRYNWMHDNADDHLDMGLYYDHGTQNIISHHNVVWGVGYSGLHINHYAYYHLVYNNTINGGRYAFRSNWGNKYSPDLYGCRFFNNIFTGACETKAGNYTWGYNQEDYDGLMDYKYLPDGSFCIDNGMVIEDITDNFIGNAPDLGAYEKGGEKWIVGHDFENPPLIDTTRSKPLYRNRIFNSAFEHEDHLEPWTITKGDISLESGNKLQITPDTARIRMGGWSIELQPDAEIAQIVRGLDPNTWYEFAGFLRVDRNERAYLGVRDHGRKESHSPSVSGNSPNWYRCILHFKTGPNQTRATVFVRRVSDGSGEVFADDFGLVYVRKE